MTRQVVITLLVLLMVLSSSCRAATPPNANYVVTGNADGAPTGCSPQDIARRIVEMFDAINRSDPNVVDEYFGRKASAPFEWYSMTEVGQNHFVAYKWADLVTYFDQRYQQHEQLQLRSVQFNAWDADRGLVHFGPIELTRHAADLKPGLGGPDSIASGKGAYHCGTKAFVVLSLVMNTTSP
jgi:hypothetical protein